MKVEIQFYVILTLDIVKDSNTTIKSCKPDLVKYPKFIVTETEVEEINYFSKHRKYTGILTIEELASFVDNCYFDSTCQTMGALTIEYGMLPAISFSCDSNYDGYNINAYISPIFSPETEKKLSETQPKDEKQAKAIAEAEICPIMDKAMDILEHYLDNDFDENTENLKALNEIHPEQLQLF